MKFTWTPSSAYFLAASVCFAAYGVRLLIVYVIFISAHPVSVVTPLDASFTVVTLHGHTSGQGNTSVLPCAEQYLVCDIRLESRRCVRNFDPTRGFIWDGWGAWVCIIPREMFSQNFSCALVLPPKNIEEACPSAGQALACVPSLKTTF